MKVERLEVGPLVACCYVVGDEKECFVIDPGGEEKRIQRAIKDRKVDFIIDTHGHADHIAANDALRKACGCPVMIHEEDAPALDDASLNGSGFFGFWMSLEPADRLLKDGEKIDFAGTQIEVIHAPGHTPGSVCLRLDGVLFSGDVLFRMGIGRADLPGGDMEKLERSVRKLYELPGDTVVYPGHGEPTTIEAERTGNPFVRQ